ncbi:MAG: hypothetical protein JF597_18670 [Streptomyces sp.]|uniref:hypothetical protein n=1 Tax=Streptomyces sp. TaxID=1931 RepID=UPI0025E5DD5F|nr:hypothetical protein [Streptomyces sp.]MBW8795540.1 hypothetical protein [Streptomyces sp.]
MSPLRVTRTLLQDATDTALRADVPTGLTATFELPTGAAITAPRTGPVTSAVTTRPRSRRRTQRSGPDCRFAL